MKAKTTGHLAEIIAQRYLMKKGLRIIETNYRTPRGEIDIVATNGHEILFVEVRSKTGTGFGSPEESITMTKKTRLVAAAEYFLQSNKGPEVDYRIDVIAIRLDAGLNPVSIDHIPYAFDQPDKT